MRFRWLLLVAIESEMRGAPRYKPHPQKPRVRHPGAVVALTAEPWASALVSELPEQAQAAESPMGRRADAGGTRGESDPDKILSARCRRCCRRARFPNSQTRGPRC